MGTIGPEYPEYNMILRKWKQSFLPGGDPPPHVYVGPIRYRVVSSDPVRFIGEGNQSGVNSAYESASVQQPSGTVPEPENFQPEPVETDQEFDGAEEEAE